MFVLTSIYIEVPLSFSSTPHADERCQNFISTLEEEDEGAYVWRTIAPNVRGSLIFSPESDFTNTIVKEVNETAQPISLACI